MQIIYPPAPEALEPARQAGPGNAVAGTAGNDGETAFFCATIGFFDGVHQGHRFLLQQVGEAARLHGLKTMAVTFADHPRRTLQTDYRPRLLTTTETKLSLLADCGLDACAVLQFTPEMAALSAREFMQRYLFDCLRVRCLVIGYDHRFGAGRNEGFADYCAYGREMGMEVTAARPLCNEEYTVSSSVVRRFLENGCVEKARECLGRYYHLRGTVVSGHHMGHGLGFPTANLCPEHPDLLVPACGVYAVYAETGCGRYPAMLNIGHRPTLNNGNDRSIEAHLFGFDGNLYGQTLTLQFVGRLRNEQKFDSLDQLKAQLQKDESQALQILSPC